MEGKTFVFNIFVSENPDWDFHERSIIKKEIEIAQEWLKRQAKTYKKEIVFINKCYGYEKGPVIIQNLVVRLETPERKNLLDRLIKMIGFKTKNHLISWVKDEHHCDNAIILILADKIGRSYATSSKNEQFLRKTVLYKNYFGKHNLSASTIAHEILHLFGAWDLYECWLHSKKCEQLARERWPGEIMIGTCNDIEKHNIGELTAWLIGLHDDYQEWYEQFRPEED